MGRFLIVSKIDRLNEYEQLSKQYSVGFEINDFYNPAILDNEKELDAWISVYRRRGIPEQSTMHGAFLDVVVFSEDDQIRRISENRMWQSMEIARRLGVKGVVFHTNSNPVLSGEVYDARVVQYVSAYVEKLLQAFPELDIYLENMFDADPQILQQISERLCIYPNYGVCLDYAHASISDTPIEVWVDTLAPYICHVHINDNDLKKDLHQAVGDGRIDWKRFAAYYRQFFSTCTVLVETTLPEQQKKSLTYLQEVLGLL